MEHTKHPIPDKARVFFNNISDYLDINLLYFGSIQRKDYFPGKSDIDVDVFASNVSSTLAKMKQYMNLPNEKVKKVFWKLGYSDKVVTGYKMMYKTEDFSAEFSLYDEKFKQDVIFEHTIKSNLPFYVEWLLIIIKVLHYQFEILDRDLFSYAKEKILNVLLGSKEIFVVVK